MKRFGYIAICFALGMASTLGSCSNNDEPDKAEKPAEKPIEKPEDFVLKERHDIALTQSQKEGVALQNDFAFRLFQADIQNNTSNSLISPLSLTMCLSMAANGASEEVKEQLIQQLLPSGGDLQQLNALNKYLIEELKEVDNSTILTLANSAWVDKNYSFLTPFSTTIKEYYNAESGSLDMYSAEAGKKINEWVSETTNGLIPTLFPGAPKCVLTLINTMYFNGAWSDPFEEEFTKADSFTNADGSTKRVDFMNKYGHRFNSAITEDYSAVELPYGNEAFSCYAVLPADGSSLTLTPEKWEEIKGKMSDRKVTVSMPKFEVEYDVEDIEKKMQDAGISKLFTATNPLANTVTPSLRDSYVKMVHKTVFKVNEIGAEGAGLTSITMVEAAGPDVNVAPTPEIILNRPFVYIIEEQSTGAILFIGNVRNL